MQPIQLSDAQLVILTAACQRKDRAVFPITAPLKGGAVGIVLKTLLKKGLVETVPAGDHDVVWCNSEAGEAVTLRTTPLTFQVLGIEEPDAGAPAQANVGDTEADVTGQGRADVESTAQAPTRRRRAGSKQAALITMLQRPEGASLDEIVGATGWQAHTVRGAIAGALKKRLGLIITSERIEGHGRVYRIEA